MNISGIRPSIGFYDYNSISGIRHADDSSIAEQVTNQAAVDGSAETESKADSHVEDGGIRQTFGAYDYANQYNPNATYEMSGADSDIRSYDVEKAINDMQKDQLLHEYQYFVGRDVQKTPDSAVVRGAEDFSL